MSFFEIGSCFLEDEDGLRVDSSGGAVRSRSKQRGWAFTADGNVYNARFLSLFVRYATEARWGYYDERISISHSPPPSSLPTRAKGWRNWNYFEGNISQSIMEQQMEALTSRTRTVQGMTGLHSLADLGCVLGCLCGCPLPPLPYRSPHSCGSSQRNLLTSIFPLPC